MSFRLFPRFLPAAFLIAVSIPLMSQVTYDAREGGSTISFGAGASNFDPYVAQSSVPPYAFFVGNGYGRMWGVTAWADAGVPFGAPWMRNLGIEAQFQSIFAGGSAGQENLKETNTGGGVIYTVHHWRSVRPFGKYIFSLGRADFTPAPKIGGGSYSHDSRAINSIAGGLEVRCTQHIWARAEYDEQLWGSFLGVNQFQPSGLTAGVMYHLGRFYGNR